MQTSHLERAASLHTRAWNHRAAELRSLTTASLPAAEQLAVRRELSSIAAPASALPPTGSRTARMAWAERQLPLWTAFAKASPDILSEFMSAEAFAWFMADAFRDGAGSLASVPAADSPAASGAAPVESRAAFSEDAIKRHLAWSNRGAYGEWQALGTDTQAEKFDSDFGKFLVANFERFRQDGSANAELGQPPVAAAPVSMRARWDAMPETKRAGFFGSFEAFEEAEHLRIADEAAS